MGPYFKCCNCKTAEGVVNPKTELLYEEHTEMVPIIKVSKNGKKRTIKEPRKVTKPLVIEKKNQNFATGEIYKQQVHASKDLEPRIIQAGVRFGDQHFQVDLCVKCAKNSEGKELLDKLIQWMEKIKCQ